MTGYDRTQTRGLNYRLFNYRRQQTLSAARARYDQQIADTRMGLEAYKSTGLATEDVVQQIEAQIARLERERAAL